MISIETLIAVVSQLLGLLRSRKEHKEDEFSTFVEPLFVETEKIIGDYLQIFQNVIESIRTAEDYMHALFSVSSASDNTGKNAILAKDFETREQISEEYEKNRQKLLYARIKVVELAEVYAESNLSDEIKDFAVSIKNVFYATTSNLTNVLLPWSVEVSEELLKEVYDNNPGSLSLTLPFLEMAVKEIHENWKIASNKYAHLRIKSKRLR